MTLSKLSLQQFPPDFVWGLSTSAYQVEGSIPPYGKGDSIWDHFSNQHGKIKNNHKAHLACDFIHRYEEDLDWVKFLGFKHFRFSISWPRIFPQGVGEINPEGVAYYSRLIQACLDRGITPWITLYHWELPWALQLKGGWANREIVEWFEAFTRFCIETWGSKVQHWMILNEPSAFTGMGYGKGYHAPGKKNILDYFAAVHHAALCQSAGARIIRSVYPKSKVGTTFALFALSPFRENNVKDLSSLSKMDALLNRLFLEPCLGLGYPIQDFKLLSMLKLYIKKGDMDLLPFDFDFIGMQYYCRLSVQHSYAHPPLFAKEVTAAERNVPRNNMGYEIYPQGMKEILLRLNQYSNIPDIYITECGISLDDHPNSEGEILDNERIAFFKSYIQAMYEAMQEGVLVKGFMPWTLTDNFEWSEGYDARFGLVHVNHKTQVRTVKSSGYWFKDFLTGLC